MRAVRATILPGCPISEVAALELQALDDGPPRASAFAEVPLDQSVALPTFPEGARAFVARGRDRTGTLVALGILDVQAGAASGPLYRAFAACSMIDASGGAARVPALESPAIGVGPSLVVLAGGRDASGAARSDLVALVPRTAEVVRTGLRRRRAGAAVAIFPEGAVVAGGASDGAIWEDAEWVDATSTPPVVAATAIALAEPRADAATVILGSGEALLVGGIGPRGVLATLEAIDPATRVVRTLDLARLGRPRRRPVAARLATGEIAVLGGIDDAGLPVPDVEVLDPAASKVVATLSLPAERHVSAVALPSGALLVGRADEATIEPSLVRLDPSGVVAQPLPPIASAGGAPRLITATDGAPFLFDGTIRRFDPWSGSFVAAPVAPLLGAAAEDVFALGDGVLAATTREGATMSFLAARYDVRTSLVNDPEPLGLGSTAHLVPDRVGVAATREGLVLPAGARVALADATFGAVSIRLGASGRALPAVELRALDGQLVARVDDEGACRFPKGNADATEILRDAEGTIEVRVGDATTTCAAAIAGAPRVMVTLVAGTREARVRGMTVTRR